jgi:tetratricopeptide (TPR) repeat protein
MKREDILAVYKAGPDAMVALIEQLQTMRVSMRLLREKNLIAIAGLMLFLAACQAGAAATAPPEQIGTEPLSSAQAYLERGDVYAARENWKQAIGEYDQAIRLNPTFAEAYNNRGYAEYWGGRSDEAIADLSKAIDLRPIYPFAFNSRGVVYMSTGHPDQAIADFDRAIALQPDFPQAYRNRASANLRTGRVALALADFRRGGGIPVATIGLLCGVPVVLALLAIGAAQALRRMCQR